VARFRFQFGLRSLMIGVCVLAVPLACVAWFYRFVVTSNECRHIERSIESLAQKPPNDMTRGQWASAVAWTRNLHGNSLLLHEASRADIFRFSRELEQRLRDDVDMATIDWIWDEYARLCPHGKKYQRFRPFMMEEIATVSPDSDSWGIYSR